MGAIRHFRDLRVYQSGLATSMKLFELTKSWPREEKYSLVDQIRRSSGSVCANISEAWRKRRYVAHFVSKLSDADGEAGQTQSWLDFALRCGSITPSQFAEFDAQHEEISGGLVKMMASPEKWRGPANLVKEEAADYVTESQLKVTHSSIPPFSHCRLSTRNQSAKRKKQDARPSLQGATARL
jgi:four helix bundle protein